MSVLRQYEPVWIAIKKNPNPPTGKFSCEISAHKAHHSRIIKAVVKEKDMDVGYKLECSEMNPPQRSRLRVTTLGSIIKFKLTLQTAITVDTI